MDDELVTGIGQGQASSPSSASNPEFERVKDRAKDLREDVSALTAETMVALRKSIDDLSALVASNALDARNRGYAELDNLKDSIKRNPLQSIALAACGGLIVGLWRRRNIER